MDHEQVKLEMFQLIPGWGGGRWRRDSSEEEKYRALMSSTKYSPKLLEDIWIIANFLEDSLENFLFI